MIRGYVFGGDTTIKRLAALGPKLLARLTIYMRRKVYELQAHVKRDKLSGQVLHVRTGTLRRSIYGKVEQRPNSGVIGIVGTNLSYAPIHEFGFDGPQSVKAHLRQVVQAFGKPLGQPREVQVRAFVRQVHIPERSFLRSALDDMRGDIERGLENEIRAAAREWRA